MFNKKFEDKNIKGKISSIVKKINSKGYSCL